MRNVKIRRTERPQEQRERVKNSSKVAVWCAMSVNYVLGLYNIVSPVLTDASYEQLLASYFLPMLHSLP